jgi:A/G-specific adenine glycosylase
VVGFCTARNPESLPAKKPRRKVVALLENCAWVIAEGRILLERQTGPRWRGLWKLPRLEAAPSETPAYQSEYPFTHHRVTLRVYKQRSPRAISAEQAWFEPSRLEEAAMASPHRRAVEALSASVAKRPPTKKPLLQARRKE